MFSKYWFDAFFIITLVTYIFTILLIYLINKKFYPFHMVPIVILIFVKELEIV